jgi:hypothetical protein
LEQEKRREQRDEIRSPFSPSAPVQKLKAAGSALINYLRSVKSPWFTIAAALVISGGAVFAQSAQDQAAIARIEKKLHSIIIPKLEFREATFREALDFLKKKSVELDDDTASLREPSVYKPRQDVLPAAPRPVLPQSVEDTRMTVSLTNIPLYEALQYITNLADVKFWIGPDGVHITTPADPEPMYTRDYYLPADFFEPGERDMRRQDIREFLEANGMSFGEGAAAILDDRARRLTVHNTEEQLRLFPMMIKADAESKHPPIPRPGESKVVGGAPGSRTRTKERLKMERIIVPELAFENVPLSEAIKKLNEMGRRWDTRGPEEERGVIIFIGKQDSKAANPPPFEADPKISYAAKQVSLWDATNAIVRLTAYKLATVGFGVKLRPPLPPNFLFTREYLVPPNFQLPKWKETADVELLRRNARDWLTSGAVAFSASVPQVQYLPKASRVLVADTEEKQQRFLKVVEDQWDDYYAMHRSKKTRSR